MDNWMILIITLISGIILTPIVIKFALKFGFVDNPNERKVHKVAIPRLGGLAIYLSFNFGLILFYLFTDMFNHHQEMFWGLLIGGSIIAVLGIVDDKLELSARTKFIGQIIAAVVVMLIGIEVNTISNPFGEGAFHLGWFAVPITIIWIVGITNAVNLIDGLDGLAGGISGIAALSIAIIAFLANKDAEGYIALLLVVSLIGFLIFNFHPAKIFMGDVGSLFLGFSFAILTIKELKTITFFGVMVPILVLAIPILDTLYAIIRRKINHVPIFQPDKHHLHHRLLQKGFSQRKAVLIIYVVSLSFSMLGIMIPYVAPWVIICIFLVLMCLFQYIYSSK